MIIYLLSFLKGSVMMIETGTMLNNRYEILQKIGEGGSAIVYKAKCHILNRFVAVKVLKDEFSSDTEFVEKFKREAYAVASFSDNNIVNVYDIGTEGNVNYIIQEFVDGKTLKQIINENGKLDYKDAVSKCRQIASALVCAHRNNIIHRDIKPHNILVTKEGVLKVADFGIAKATDSVTITSTEKVMGSAHYLSPEQAKGIYVDARTDIYSLGIVLYEMLTGKVPFNGETPVTVALKHIQEPPVQPIEVNPEVPMALNNIVLKAIAKEPFKRYQTAKEFMEALDNFTNNFSTQKTFMQDEFTRVMDPIDETTLFRTNGIKDIKGAVKPKKAEIENFEDEADEELDNVKDRTKNKNSLTKGKKTAIGIILVLIVIAAIGTVAYIVGIGGPSKIGSSEKNVTVPSIVGMQQADASKILQSYNLHLVVAATKNSDKPKGTIIDSYPTVGSAVSSGSDVRVDISAGQNQPTVPPVQGDDLNSAKQAIIAAGFTVGKITQQSSDSVPNGCVISDDPSDGSAADANTAITLVVSTGPQTTTVPDVKNNSETDAVNALNRLGLSPTITTIQTQDNTLNNKVKQQDPAAGNNVKPGSVVTITVYQYVDNSVSVPSVMGKTQSDAQASLQAQGFIMSVSQTTIPATSQAQSNTVASQDKNGTQQKGSTITVTMYGQYTPPSNNNTTTNNNNTTTTNNNNNNTNNTTNNTTQK
jgi:serine/threonine protein kinase